MKVAGAFMLGASGVEALNEWAGLHWFYGLVLTGVAAASYIVTKGAK